MLQSYTSFFWQLREKSIFNNVNAVKVDGHTIAFHGNFERIPLTDILICVYFWCDTASHVRRHFFVHPITINLTGANRPAPDIRLALANPSQNYTRIGVGQRHRNWLSIFIKFMKATGQDQWYVLILPGCFFYPPIDIHDKIFVLFVSPKILVLRFTLGIVINHTIFYFPMAVITIGYFPVGEV